MEVLNGDMQIELDKIYNEDCEVWKPAKGYEEFLEVSTFGNARRKPHSFIKSNNNLRVHHTTF